MKFHDSRFNERVARHGKQTGMVMPGGFPVSKQTMIATWNQLQKSWPFIDWSVRQSTETMLGTDYWQKLHPTGARLATGRCIKFFVVHEMLPISLEVANPGKKGKRFYRPKQRVTKL